jgi:hypothetical protein
VDHGIHTASGLIDVNRPSQEGDAGLLQGLNGLDRVDGTVEWCTQVHNGDVRGVLLWEQSHLLMWKKALEWRARGAW